MRKNRFFILFLLFQNLFVFGQDPSFSQFFQKSPYVNPAYTGILGGSEIHSIIHHRSQWTSIPIRFTSSLVSLDWRVCQKNLGVGFIVFQNTEGEALYESTDISLPIAAHIPISNFHSISEQFKQHLLQDQLSGIDLFFQMSLIPF